MADPKPLRVLVVGASWPPETFLARLVSGLLDSGLEITVASARKPERRWLARPGFRWIRAAGGNEPALVRVLRGCLEAARVLGRAPGQARRLWSEAGGAGARRRFRAWSRTLPLAGRRFDLLYFPWNMAAIRHLPAFALGRPTLVSCRGSQINTAPHNPRRSSLRAGLSATFRKAAAVHCVSDAILAEAQRFGLEPAKARVIRPGVDPDFFRRAEEAREPDETFQIITTGGLNWMKGHEYALSAVAVLARSGRGVRFSIIGDGTDLPRVLYTASDLGLSDSVRLLGRLPPKEVRNALARSDVFLLSSLSEGISNAALEAMACGVPVVTTNCGGMREAVTDGVEGYVVPLRDPEAMASALSRLASDPASARRMGQAARARVLREFSLTDHVGRFVELCQEVVRGRRGSSASSPLPGGVPGRFDGSATA